MLELTEESLMREIRDAKNYLRPIQLKMGELARACAGRHYRDDPTNQSPTPENYPFAYKSFLKPQLLFGKPKVKCEPITIEYDSTARSMETAVNYWSKSTSFKRTTSQIIDDCFVGFGVSKCGVSNEPFYHGQGDDAVDGGDFDQKTNYPFCVRVDPHCYVLDSRAKTFQECRFMGHWFMQDVDDVMLDKRNDPQAVAKLTAAARDRGSDQSQGNTTRAFETKSGESERKTCLLYELWIREHGRIIVLGETSDGTAVILRNDQYVGPEKGPYTLWGLDACPGEIVPLSPLVAIYDQILEVVEHSKAAARSASTHKRFFIFAPEAAKDAERIRTAPPGSGVPVKHPDLIRDMEIGGSSEAQLNWTEYARTRCEHQLGYGSSQQGVAGGRTATAENLAAQNSDLRVDQMRDRIADSLADVLEKIAWHFFHDSSIGQIPMTSTDTATGHQVPSTFVAGQWTGGFIRNQWVPPEQPTNFDSDYYFNVDPTSLVPTNSPLEQKRAQDEMQLAFQLIGMGIPVNLRRVLDRYGETMGVKDYSKVVLLDQAGMVIPLDPLSQQQGMMGGSPGMPPNRGSGMGMSATPQAGPPQSAPGVLTPPRLPSLAGMSGLQQGPAQMMGALQRGAA